MKRTRSLVLAGCVAMALSHSAYADTILYANSAGGDGIRIFSINVAAGTETLLDHIVQGGANGITSGNGRGVVTVGTTLYYTLASSGSVYSYNLLTHTNNGILFTVAGASGLATMAWDGSSFYLGDYSGTSNVYKYSQTGVLQGTVSLSKCGEAHQGGIAGYCDGLEYANGSLVSNEGDGGFGGPSQYDVYALTGGVPTQTGLITTTYGATGIAFDGTYYFVNDITGDRIGVYASNGALVKFISLGTDGSGAIEDLSVDYNTVLVTGTPEPSTVALMATGLFGLVGISRKRRNASKT